MPAQPLIALVDCNAFYVSCECVFRPDLWDKPVGVLSNNDGCLIARNKPLKALGVKMGVPLFQVAELIKQHNVQLFSANFSLYGDMSARVMSVLETFAPQLEIYSIDEAFLDLTGVCPTDPIAYAQSIRQKVSRDTGIPVCVGLGPTKTLAKLANFAAKKWRKTQGVVDLSDPVRRERLMHLLPVQEVWGIGRRTSERLKQLGIITVWDLANQVPANIQNQFNVVIARTVMELNGIACLDLEDVAPDKQQIICSRSFSRRLSDYADVATALAEFCSRAAEKLRRQQSVTAHISVYLRTSPFNAHEQYYQRSAGIKLSIPTQDTRVIVRHALRLLQGIFKPGLQYQKCGVQLGLIQPERTFTQLDLFTLDEQFANGKPLMQVMDAINQRYPKTISLAATVGMQRWRPQLEYLSQRYTTDWNQLVTAKCG